MSEHFKPYTFGVKLSREAISEFTTGAIGAVLRDLDARRDHHFAEIRATVAGHPFMLLEESPRFKWKRRIAEAKWRVRHAWDTLWHGCDL
jgi:hypothetical protein